MGHRLHIDRWFYATDHWMHARLAEMYAYDERFSATFEKVAPGLTAFFVAGIEANALHEAGNVEVESALASARAGRGLRAPPSGEDGFARATDADDEVQDERTAGPSSSRKQRTER